MHIYLQALHDQFHDAAYWRGGFDLRHAWDIADLIHGDEPIDWDRLFGLLPTRLTAHAVEAQLMACTYLTGAPIPAASRNWRSWIRLRRQYWQYAAPMLRTPLAAFALLSEAPDLARHREGDRRTRAAAGLPSRNEDRAAGLGRVRGMLRAEPGARL